MSETQVNPAPLQPIDNIEKRLPGTDNPIVPLLRFGRSFSGWAAAYSIQRVIP
jgi:hypothetical protein